MRAFVCDKCGETYTQEPVRELRMGEQLQNGCQVLTDFISYDLCPTCAADLVKWINHELDKKEEENESTVFF